MDMVPIYSPKSESEASVITALMQAYSVNFVMRGGAFSSMYPGSLTNSLNEQTLLVSADQVEMAKDLLESFFTGSNATK